MNEQEIRQELLELYQKETKIFFNKNEDIANFTCAFLRQLEKHNIEYDPNDRLFYDVYLKLGKELRLF